MTIDCVNPCPSAAPSITAGAKIFHPINTALPRTPHPETHLAACYQGIRKTKTMLSEKQLAANRANAEKSTGPRTEVGKQRSARNALRHGLTAHVTVMTDADREAQEAFCGPIVDELDPQSPNELQLAQAYANLQWRINRLAAIEENVFTLGALDSPDPDDPLCHARTFLRDAASLNTLSIYNHRLIAESEKILEQFLHFRAVRLNDVVSRKTAKEAELKAAARMYRQSQGYGVPFDPQKNGFVCSMAEIHDYLRHRAASSNQSMDAVERKFRSAAAKSAA